MPKTRTSWVPGQSGNPDGRSKGSGKVSKLRALLDPHAEELVQKAVELALDGDTTALRLCLERLIPPYKAQGGVFEITELKQAQSLTQQGQVIVEALADGDLPVAEAGALLNAIATQARLQEFEALEARISALEARYGG